MSAVQDLLTNYQHIIGDLTIKMGSKGAFEVQVNDQMLYSKKEIGRHANPGEVLQLFEQLVGPDVPKYPQSK